MATDASVVSHRNLVYRSHRISSSSSSSVLAREPCPTGLGAVVTCAQLRNDRNLRYDAELTCAALYFDTPVLPEVQAESPVSVEQRIDPTSSTPFPTLIRAPDGSNLKLVGTGVRTVSFLGIRVYAAGFYVDERAMDRIASLEGFRVREWRAICSH